MVFYALYPIGVAPFGVLPRSGYAGLGTCGSDERSVRLLAYVTYEMTNLATLKGWSAQIALIGA